MPSLRTILQVSFGLIFVGGLVPPERPWLMFIGLAGFVGSCFIPKGI